jgi:hypothetical protein
MVIAEKGASAPFFFGDHQERQEKNAVIASAAKQSMPQQAGLLRRCAPRNDEGSDSDSPIPFPLANHPSLRHFRAPSGTGKCRVFSSK